MKFITLNEKKNFIILAGKKVPSSLAENIENKKENANFYILSQKTVNSKYIIDADK